MHYSKRVVSLKLNNVTDKVIRRVIVEVTLTDGDESVSSIHDVPLFMPNQDTFIQYGELTEQQVLDWIVIDEDMETMLNNELEIKRSVPVTANFPWDE